MNKNSSNDASISRRGFLKGSAVTAAATAIASSSAAFAEEASPTWEPQTWDYEADVVVVGYGCAGATAAITMCNENLGSVIVLEAAPPEYEGGNVRVAGDIVFATDTVEGAFEYQKHLNGAYTIDDDLLQAWAEMLGENIDWLNGLGADMQVIPRTAEFSTAPCADQVKIWCAQGGHYGDGSLWYFYKSLEEQLGYQVINNARVKSLVRNPLTNEACGATAELEDGSTINVKAHKAVIVACGGYENNPELVRNYFSSGTPLTGFWGSPYNRGDGFAMVEPFGVQLWHMNNYSGGQLSPVLFDEGYTNAAVDPKGKSWIYVGADATRFMYEETVDIHRHGKIRFHGTYMNYPTPEVVYMILGADAFEGIDSFVPKNPMQYPSQSGMIPEGGLSSDDVLQSGKAVKADTIEELAELIGLDPEKLAATIEQYNGYCADGVDPDFHRGEEYYEYGHTGIGGGDEAAVMTTEEVPVIRAFELTPIEGPFYAIEMRATFINTQGGPRRNANCQMVNSQGEAIPRLYGTGEFGAIYGYEYNGGGNIAEAIATGRTAARHAATLEAWDA